MSTLPIEATFWSMSDLEDRTVTSRSIRPDDAERLRRMFFRLSPESVYRRFFTAVSRPPESMLRHLAVVDHGAREAMVAVVEDEIVGVARYERSKDDATRAEVAVLVEDACQRHGVATYLLDRLARVAHRQGIEAFTASVLSDNQRTLDLAHYLNPASSVVHDGPESFLQIPLGARAAPVSRRQRRRATGDRHLQLSPDAAPSERPRSSAE